MAGSFIVRLKHSATPLVCGSATKAKLLLMPQNSICFRKSSAVYCRTVILAPLQALAGIGAGGTEFRLPPWAIGCRAAKRWPTTPASK